MLHRALRGLTGSASVTGLLLSAIACSAFTPSARAQCCNLLPDETTAWYKFVQLSQAYADSVGNHTLSYICEDPHPFLGCHGFGTLTGPSGYSIEWYGGYLKTAVTSDFKLTASGFTIEGWVSLAPASSPYSPSALLFGTTQGVLDSCGVRAVEQASGFRLEALYNADAVATPPDVFSWGWHHVALTVDVSSGIGTYDMVLYVDGAVIDVASGLWLGAGFDPALYLGGDESAYFKCSWDDVAVYKRALTASEINQFINQGKCSAPDCNGNGMPDHCEDGTWVGPNFGLFTDASYWSDGVVPASVATVRNTVGGTNTSVLAQVTSLCTLDLSATNGTQELQLQGSGRLVVSNPTGTGQASILSGGVLRMAGGSLEGDELLVRDCGSILGSGSLGAPGDGIALTVDPGASITVETSGLMDLYLQSSLLDGAVTVNSNSILDVHGATLTNEGRVELAVGSTLKAACVLNHTGQTSSMSLPDLAVTDEPIGGACGSDYTGFYVKEATVQTNPTEAFTNTGYLLFDCGCSGLGTRCTVTNDLVNTSLTGDPTKPDQNGVVVVSNGLLDVLGDVENHANCLFVVQSGRLDIAGKLCVDDGILSGDYCEGPDCFDDNGCPGPIPSAPPRIEIGEDLIASAASTLDLADIELDVRGDVDFAIDDPARFDLSDASLRFSGIGFLETQSLEVAAPAGADPFASFQDPARFPIGEVVVGSLARVALVDQHVNSTGGGESLYVARLELEANAQLVLGATDVVVGTLVIDPSASIDAAAAAHSSKLVRLSSRSASAMAPTARAHVRTTAPPGKAVTTRSGPAARCCSEPANRRWRTTRWS